MGDTTTPLDELLLDTLRDAGEPVREAVLHERVRERGSDDEPEVVIAALHRLGELGHVHVAFDRETPAHDPEPFQARMWRILR